MGVSPMMDKQWARAIGTPCAALSEDMIFAKYFLTSTISPVKFKFNSTETGREGVEFPSHAARRHANQLLLPGKWGKRHFLSSTLFEDQIGEGAGK
ncbi:hypothetical protein EVAR_30686_1 [Eumeta japonica]|uniref:Uncharacterized protein n=1 Tax=Eumeta variegata TaxID=151549 RepID=A0A4C1VQ44_EUMVA|nr:hypothetical protein EVAR_30686_1 [Eumeta japonica]